MSEEEIPQAPVLTWNGTEWVPTMEVSDDDSGDNGDAIPDSDLYYRVDEGEGSTLNDGQGSNDGDVQGSTTWVANEDFDGGFYLQMGDDGVVQSARNIDPLSDSFSIGIRINADENYDGDGAYAWTLGDGSGGKTLVFDNNDIAQHGWDGSSSDGGYYGSQPSAPFTVELLTTVEDGVWDGLWIDEVEQTDFDESLSNTTTSDEFSWGNRDDLARDGGLGIDAIAVWEDEVIDPDDYFGAI